MYMMFRFSCFVHPAPQRTFILLKQTSCQEKKEQNAHQIESSPEVKGRNFKNLRNHQVFSVKPLKTNMTLENSPWSIGNIYIDSFMVDFSASHVSFRGGRGGVSCSTKVEICFWIYPLCTNIQNPLNWRIIPGLGYVVNDFLVVAARHLGLCCGTPFKNRLYINGLYIGGDPTTTYKSWDNPSK